MTPLQDQVEWFMRLMQTKVQRRCWIHHCRHRAEQLEKAWPVEYAGLVEALKAALASQKFSPPSKDTSMTGEGEQS